MEDKIQEIKYKVNRLLGETSIEVLKDEKEIIETLERILKEPKIECDDEILDNIEEYLETKEQIKVKENDMEFLANLAKSLREQEVRLSDDGNPPLFKIRNSIGEEVYFITREALNEYREFNKESSRIIEIPKSNSIELSKLIDIIKRNF